MAVKRGHDIEKIIQAAAEIERESAVEAGALGFMARILVQTTLPHSKVEGSEYTRVNGNLTLTINAPSKIGIPYGSIPRVLLLWLTTEAVRNKNKAIFLGDTLTEFMQQLNLVPTGGRWGSIPRLRDQMRKLAGSTFTCVVGEEDLIGGVKPISKYYTWWDKGSPNQGSLWRSEVVLTEDFFNEIIDRPIPIDTRVIKSGMRSPFFVDVYCWTTYKMSYLKKKTAIPWELLPLQFGSNYALNPQGVRDFKRAFLRQLKKIKVLYSELHVDYDSTNLILYPSPTHVPKLQYQARTITEHER